MAAFLQGRGPGGLVLFAAIVVFSLAGLYLAPRLIEHNLFRPYWLVRRGQYHTIVSSGFLHADLAHLIFNLITFWFFAFPLERVLGTARFLVLYFAGLLLSHLGTWFKHRSDPDYASLGASGAILAVLFAYIVYFPTSTLFILPIPFPIPAPLFAVGYLAYTYFASRQQRGRINHDAHLSGALTGLAFVALADPGAYGEALRSIGG